MAGDRNDGAGRDAVARRHPEALRRVLHRYRYFIPPPVDGHQAQDRGVREGEGQRQQRQGVHQAAADAAGANPRREAIAAPPRHQPNANNQQPPPPDRRQANGNVPRPQQPQRAPIPMVQPDDGSRSLVQRGQGQQMVRVIGPVRLRGRDGAVFNLVQDEPEPDEPSEAARPAGGNNNSGSIPEAYVDGRGLNVNVANGDRGSGDNETG